MFRVLNVDCPPGVLSASHLPSLPVLQSDVTAHHAEWNGLVSVQVKNIDLMILQLGPQPLSEGGQFLPSAGVTLTDDRNDVDLENWLEKSVRTPGDPPCHEVS